MRHFYKFFYSVTGFVLGFFLFLLITNENHVQDVKLSHSIENTTEKLYTTEMAESLFHEIKILCLIMTCPKNHKTRAIFVKQTWGRKCNKLLFISSEDDPELDIIKIKVTNDSRMALRNKTRETFLHVQRNYIKDFDWFMKADDDAYVIMENLRYMLYQYRSQTAFLFGHRFAVNITNLEEGYMAGFSYILSRRAVTKFARNVLKAPPYDSIFFSGMGEDLRLGKMLRHDAIFVDCRDELKQKRFFPMPPTLHLQNVSVRPDTKYWYHTNLYYNSTQGGLGCCSDVPVGFHYIKNQTMYFLEHMIYQMTPFGIEKNLTETLPRKLSLKEIIEASDAKSSASNFMNHTDFHNFDKSEEF